MFVRPAEPGDALEVRRILDAAMLEPGDVETRIDHEDVLVAGDRKGGSTTEACRTDRSTEQERLLGTLVLEPRDRGACVSAIGVRRRHRNRAIGRTLVDRALEREGRLTARFAADVRPFYEAIGFSIERLDDSRYRGVAVASDALE